MNKSSMVNIEDAIVEVANSLELEHPMSCLECDMDGECHTFFCSEECEKIWKMGVCGNE